MERPGIVSLGLPKFGPGSFRLVLAMVVVMHHSAPIRLGAWAVGLFFCLSGFWIAEMWGKKYSKLDRPYLEFLISRWWRLAPVMFFMTILSACAIHWKMVSGDPRVLGSVTWWLTQPLIAGSTHFGWLLPPTWSLDVEMQFYIAAPVLILLLMRLPGAISTIVLLGAVVWLWVEEKRGVAGDAPRLDIWLPIFLIGMLASITRWRPNARVAVATGTAAVVVMAFAAAIPATRSWILIRGATGHQLTGALAATLTVGTILLSAPFAILTTRRPSPRWDRFLGDLSYPLYLFHWLPRMWYYDHLHGDMRPSHMFALLSINVIAALLGGVLILVLIDRPIQNVRASWVKRHQFVPSKGSSVRATEAESLEAIVTANA